MALTESMSWRTYASVLWIVRVINKLLRNGLSRSLGRHFYACAYVVRSVRILQYSLFELRAAALATRVAEMLQVC